MKTVTVIAVSFFVFSAQVAEAHWPKACVSGKEEYSHGKKLEGQKCVCKGYWALGENRRQPPREWRCEWK